MIFRTSHIDFYTFGMAYRDKDKELNQSLIGGNEMVTRSAMYNPQYILCEEHGVSFALRVAQPNHGHVSKLIQICYSRFSYQIYWEFEFRNKIRGLECTSLVTLNFSFPCDLF